MRRSMGWAPSSEGAFWPLLLKSIHALGAAAKDGRGEGQVTFSRIRGVVQNAVQGAGLG